MLSQHPLNPFHPINLAQIKDPSDLLQFRGIIEMEHPNNLIDSFTGVVTLNNESAIPILPHNLLLRGTVLRNTDSIIGLVVNTGHDTKIMMSSTNTKVRPVRPPTSTSHY